MAKKIIVELLLKDEIPAGTMTELKDMILLKLKAKVMKEKEKGKKLIWLMDTPKPENVTQENLTIIFKRLKLIKIVRGIEISAA